ncbi:hypothetical protein [Micromonospora sp. NPDC005652]|uniref:hypothetical protein n=1 Tax=Micromonospora sp. NPDC005652 TaxID=3157046 RepID=UPI0033ED9BD0
MEKRWIEVEPLGPQPSGDVGGDGQVSEAYGRRFALPRNDEEQVPVMDVYYYVGHEDRARADSPLSVQRQVQYTLCTDLADPGSTEVWSDMVYQTLVGPAGEPTDDDARRMCAEMPAPGLGDWTGSRSYGEAVLRRIVLAEANARRARRHLRYVSAEEDQRLLREFDTN